MGKYYFGVDVGGTSIKIGVFDEKKKLIDKYSIKTQISKKESEKNLVKYILDSLEKYCIDKTHNINKKNIIGIGFDIPGPVVDNQVLRAVNINWKHKYDIVAEIQKRFGKNVKSCVINDANAATIAEYSKTLKGRFKNICLMTLGTAVGTGVIINGKLIEGRTGIAGELCHIKVDNSEDAIKCNCGNVGCFETLVSGRGIVSIYKRMYLKNKLDTDVVKIGSKNIQVSKIESKDITDEAKKGDEKTLKALETSLDYLSDMVAVLMHVYEPEVVLIGGGVSYAGAIITNMIKKQLKNKIYITKTMPKIMIAKLKNDAGIYGVVAKL